MLIDWTMIPAYTDFKQITSYCETYMQKLRQNVALVDTMMHTYIWRIRTNMPALTQRQSHRTEVLWTPPPLPG